MPEIDPKSKELYDAMKYSLLAGGKRIRPVLLLAAYDLGSRPLRLALPHAIAAEYIHTYSLIHDDLPAMDDDDLRRGMPTCHKVHGEAMAILAGDGLLSAAHEIMSKSMLLHMDDAELLKCIVRAVFSINKGTGVRGMVAGQASDVESEGKNVSNEMLEYIHYQKTAAFIRACVMAGGFLAGLDQDTMNDLDIYGENVGLAFQVVDDILDVVSSVEDLGHTIGKDAAQGKQTFPAMFGIEKSKEIANAYLDKAMGAIEKYYDNAAVLAEVVKMLRDKIA